MLYNVALLSSCLMLLRSDGLYWVIIHVDFLLSIISLVEYLKGGQLENDMLPDNDVPNQYTSLVSLDSNNVNMKGLCNNKGLKIYILLR